MRNILWNSFLLSLNWKELFLCARLQITRLILAKMVGRSPSWSTFRRFCIFFKRSLLLVYLLKHCVCFFFVQSVMLRYLIHFIFAFILLLFFHPLIFTWLSIIILNLFLSFTFLLYFRRTFLIILILLINQ